MKALFVRLMAVARPMACASLAAALATTSVSAAVIIDSFSTATGGTGNAVQNTGAPCVGPAIANHSGTDILGGAGTRSMTMVRTSGSGTGCVGAVVDQGGTFNDLRITSDPTASGTLVLSALGSNYTWLVSDTGVSLLASHNLSAAVTATLQLFLRVAGVGYVGAAPVTINTNTLSNYSIDRTAFNVGGSISPGDIIDGYQMVIDGGIGSGITIDDIQIVGALGDVPEPSTYAMVAMGAGLIALSLRRRSREV